MKNKIFLFILLIGLVLIPIALADNPRFADLTTDSLGYITIDAYNTIGEPESKTINDCKQIKQIVDFLQGMDLIDYSDSDTSYPLDRNAWLYHISLNGYFNKIYLFENSTFIGKSVYGIKPEIVAEFRRLYNEL